MSYNRILYSNIATRVSFNIWNTRRLQLGLFMKWEARGKYMILFFLPQSSNAMTYCYRLSLKYTQIYTRITSHKHYLSSKYKKKLSFYNAHCSIVIWKNNNQPNKKLWKCDEWIFRQKIRCPIMKCSISVQSLAF